MAIQNIVSGGYYGKLGETVGQRWKNLRTIRSYVIPHDPKTLLQRTQRNNFRQAVLYSQVALAGNWQCDAFDDENITRWNVRMSTARKLQDLGQTELNLLPLLPINFIAPYSITSITLSTVNLDGSKTFTIVGSLPTVERVLSIYVYNTSQSFDIGNIQMVFGQFDGVDSVTVDAEHADILARSYDVRIVSADDSTAIEDAVISQQLTIL